MKLTVLGSGSTVPHPTRSSAAFWLETGGGNILLDCSASAPYRMAYENVDWPNIDAIWISHFHMDHCGGLGPLLSGTKHSDKMQGREKPLRIFGPAGLAQLISKLDAQNNYCLIEQPFPVEIIEIDELERFEIVKGVEAISMKTQHTDESLAIHIRDADKTLVYTSDTGFDASLAAFATGVDMFLLECTFYQSKLVEKHLVLAEAMHLIRKAKPGRAMLTHFYPEWDSVSFEKESGKFNPRCKVFEAVDGLIIVI